jgi:hypothetical protein
MKRMALTPLVRRFMTSTARSGERSSPYRPAPRGLGLIAAAGFLALLSACNPTKGFDPNAFKQAPTTNTDFLPAVEIPVGLEPTTVAIAPRGTGCSATDPNFLAPNAAVANFGDNTVTFLKNDGLGNFTTQSLAVGSGPAVVQFADLDGSNAISNNCSFDIVVLLAQNAIGAGNGVTVLLTSDNTTWTAQTLFYGVTPAQIQVADMNGDGFPDLVASLPETNQIAINLNDGMGHFNPTVVMTLPASPGRFIVADYLGTPLDFDGDGCTDMAVLFPATSQVAVITSKNGSTACAPPALPVAYNTATIYPTTTGPVEIAAGNVSGGTTVPDLVVLTASQSYLEIFKNSGTFPATFTAYPGAPVLLRAAPYRMALAKFDGTNLGIAIVHPSDKSGGVVQWNGAGFVQYIAPVRQTPFDVAAGIFTTSMKLDLVFPESQDRIIFVAHGDGTGTAFSFTQIGLDHIPGAPALGRLRPTSAELPIPNPASPTDPQDMLVTEKNNRAVLYFKNKN